jgi:hypothetical protein
MAGLGLRPCRCNEVEDIQTNLHTLDPPNGYKPRGCIKTKCGMTLINAT